jgi:hypothetical protein
MSPQPPHFNFHDKFKKHENTVANNKQDFERLNSTSVNDQLRTRPTNKANMSVDNSHGPSIQKYNRKGKLY